MAKARRARMARLEYYLDSDRQWRWRFRASNGKIVADSAEGYKQFFYCQKGYLAMAIPITIGGGVKNGHEVQIIEKKAKARR